MENNLKLIDCVNAVAEFHDSFGIPNKYKPLAKVDEKDLNLRYSLMKEENEEYLQAAKEGAITAGIPNVVAILAFGNDRKSASPPPSIMIGKIQSIVVPTSSYPQ